MRICTFLKDGAAKLGGVNGDTIVELAQASGDAPEFANAHTLIQGGAAALTKAANVMSDAQDAARHALTSVQLAALVMQSSGNLMRLSMSYRGIAFVRRLGRLQANSIIIKRRFSFGK